MCRVDLKCNWTTLLLCYIDSSVQVGHSSSKLLMEEQDDRVQDPQLTKGTFSLSMRNTLKRTVPKVGSSPLRFLHRKDSAVK